MIKAKPFFSIIIPTYKRPKLLKAAIKIFLAQTFTDLEIVVIDDCSPDNTRGVVSAIKDKRIRYIRNPKNLGQEPNFKKAFGLGRGKYLFITGDDDYVLYPDTLEKVHNLIIKKNYGFVKLNLIEKKFIGKGLRKSIIHCEQDIVIAKGSSPEKIIDFFRTVAVGHMSGLIFKNESWVSAKLFSLQETPWVRILYELTHKYGAIYLSKYYMIITWSQLAILHLYDVIPTKPLMMEEYVNYIYTIMPRQKRDVYKWNYYKVFALLQPVIKLYSNNRNLIEYDKRLFVLEPRLKKTPLLWCMLFVSLLTPNYIWRFVRVVQHKNKNFLHELPNLQTVIDRYSYLEKTYLMNNSE